MFRQYDQKLKILYVKECLEKYSSKSRPVNAQFILSYLEEHGITAERKSIYDDINTLINYGLDIVKISGRDGGYYIDKGLFSREEIKLLLDTLNSSKYVDSRTVNNLSNKLSNYLPHDQAVNFSSKIYVNNRVRIFDKNLFDNLDELDTAIQKAKLVLFRYLEWNISYTNNRVEYSLQTKNSGQVYSVYPLQVIFQEQNYYLIAIELENYEYRHFRIDKIIDLEISLSSDSKASKLAARFDPSRYSMSIFDMFSGDEKSCKIAFHKDLIGPMFERFGDDMIILKSKLSDYFETIQLIKVSPKFIAWVISYEGKIKLLGPNSVIDIFKTYIDNIASDYIY